MDNMPWNEIRAGYKTWPVQDRYFIDWVKYMTPIENRAWQDMAGFDMELMPQYPVGNVFVDFGNPEKKIALELDGKIYHNAEKDYLRDKKLFDEYGWIVYRAKGYESHICQDIYELRDNCRELDVHNSNRLVEHFFDAGTYSLIYSIAHRHFGMPVKPIRYDCGTIELDPYISYCLKGHRLYR